MKRKKLTALMMVAAMAVSMLAGCGDNKGTDAPSESGVKTDQDSLSGTASSGGSGLESEGGSITFPLEEPVEITVYVCTGDSQFKFEDTAVYKVMEEKTNVKLKIVTSTNLTENEEKRNVQINSGDYPDVFIKSGLSPDELYEYGQEGIFIALDDLIDQYMPNYKALIDERDAWAEVTSGDGHIYSTYEICKPNVGNTPHVWINTKWLENVNKSMPTTADEFYEVLKAFKEQDADGDGDPNNEIPWITSSDISPVEFILPYFGFNMSGWWDPWCVSQDEESIEFFPATERYKEALAFIAKCYDEGLLYKDSFNITCDQIRSMGQTGEALGVFGEWHPQNTVGAYDKTKSEEENIVLQYQAMVPWEEGGCPTAGGLNRGGLAITDKCKYPEIMCAWVDYLYSEEGAILSTYGIEGDTYDMVDGKIKARDKENPSTTWGENIDHALFQMGGGTFRPAKCYSDTYEVYVDLTENPIANILEDTFNSFEDAGKLYKAWPTLNLTEEEIAANGDINADVDAYRKTYRAEVITGKKDLDSTWDEYLKTLNDMGLQTAVDNMNAAYDRYKVD